MTTVREACGCVTMNELCIRNRFAAGTKGGALLTLPEHQACMSAMDARKGTTA